MDLFQPSASGLFGFAGLLDRFPVEVIAGSVSLATSVFLLLALRMVDRQNRHPRTGRVAEHHAFRLENGRFEPLSAAAGKFLCAATGGKQDGFLYPAQTGEEAQALSALEEHGTAFRYEVLAPDGRAFDVAGRPAGNTPLVTISELGEDRRMALELAGELRRATEQNRQVRAALEAAPVAAWQLDAGGAPVWLNAACRSLSDTGGDGGGLAPVLRDLPGPGEPLGRVRITSGGQDRWLDVSQHRFGGNGSLGLAVDVTPQVIAEASLSRFVETLTVTFAHLPIGLAVFDHDRRLGLFNPALGDLLKLDAAWLAGQPTLREFLERLRENRQMPDQKDFLSWRRQLSALEEGAENGSYSEVWILPSGQNFRVTGRPHPQGALAFLFEDISGAVQLEERRRAETALNQTLVDRLSEAIAVFDTSGRLSFFNIAFSRLWEGSAPELAARPDIAAMADHWQSRCEATTVWEEVKSFASGATERSGWRASVRLLGGQALDCQFAPMPDGSTLAVFQAAEASGNVAMPATKAEDDVSDSDMMETGKFFSGLEDILHPRGVRLETGHWEGPAEPALPARALRRIAWNMILAVVELAPDAKVIAIARGGAGGAVTLTAGPGTQDAARNTEAGGIAFRVLSQFVDRQGGTLKVNPPARGQAFSLACILPQHGMHADPAPQAQGRPGSSASRG